MATVCALLALVARRSGYETYTTIPERLAGTLEHNQGARGGGAGLGIAQCYYHQRGERRQNKRAGENGRGKEGVTRFCVFLLMTIFQKRYQRYIFAKLICCLYFCLCSFFFIFICLFFSSSSSDIKPMPNSFPGAYVDIFRASCLFSSFDRSTGRLNFTLGRVVFEVEGEILG